MNKIFLITFLPLVFGGISPELNKKLIENGPDQEPLNIMISFTTSMDTVFDQINSQNFSTIEDKRTALTEAQIAFTNTVQADLQKYLEVQGIDYESFWISNNMFVKDANENLINSIANFPGVDKVEEEGYAIIDSSDESESKTGQSRNTQWGVSRIRAPEVWDSGYTGRGVVVGMIDTGVRHTHETLTWHWRGDYGWFDPKGKSATPYDHPNSHGTHIMGTIAGMGGIGVCPDCTWVACKACDENLHCPGNHLLSCGQWIQCPTNTNGDNRDCSKAPRVVNNSWMSRTGNNNWYRDVITSWHNSGIIPVFCIGNSGPNCSTTGHPGENRNVIGVGATDSNERIASFSSLGPAWDGSRIKPDITAPGNSITSAGSAHDRDYTTKGGCSMATPHVTGVIALMLQKNPRLSYDQIYSAITRTTTKSLDTSNAKTCGGKSGSQFPNNVFGYGRIDAVNSVNAV